MISPRLIFDIYTDSFLVEEGEGIHVPARDFYIAKRRASGRSVGEIERTSGITHPKLANLEKPNNKGYQSNSIGSILAGLEAIGYTIVLEKN